MYQLIPAVKMMQSTARNNALQPILRGHFDLVLAFSTSYEQGLTDSSLPNTAPPQLPQRNPFLLP
jgi:hypothetical protein